MTTFSAVVTTGIYCRPGCPGRPDPGNVRPFTLAAAAEAAGFRACLRCRPYRTANSVSWTGPELVCRAVRLISDGALDEANETELGARLGVSPRHLRRLFNDHLGLTPDQLARSRRTHFARRLLDDTDLTITDIAFASGFGSVRQLNRACVELFRSTPTVLRARRRSTDRLVADGGMVLRLPFAEPFDWDAMLQYFSARAIAGVENVSDGVYRRTARIDGAPGVLEVWRGGDDHLRLRAHLPYLEGLIHVVERTRRIFALDADPAEAVAQLHNAEHVGALVATRPGLRTPGTWDAFETGVRAIVGQQVSVAGANTIMARIVERAGETFDGLAPLGLARLFPEPAALAVANLDGLGLTTARSDAIRSFARAVANDEIPLDGSVSLERFVAIMCAVPGIGPWTAHYLALRIGEPDAFPASDLGLRRALDPSAPLTTAALSERAQAWRPWRALAATHLWFHTPAINTVSASTRRPSRSAMTARVLARA